MLPVDPAMREIPRLPGDIPVPLRCDRDSIGNVIHFANKKEGWALVKNDVGSQLFYTNDSGKTWRLQFSGAIMPYKSPFVGGPGRGADTGKSYKLLSIFLRITKGVAYLVVRLSFAQMMAVRHGRRAGLCG